MREEMRSHRALAGLAKSQYGIVTSGQLREMGFSTSAIGRAAGAGRLHRVHRGVYAVGHPAVGRHGRCLAGVLACGEGAALSHGAAGWLWGLFARCSQTVDVTVPRRGKRRHGIRLHHAPALGSRDRDETERIPVTSLPRTLLDLAATGPSRRLTNAVDKAKRMDRLDLPAIDELLARQAGAAGSRALRKALDLYRAPVFDRARSELLFLDLVRQAGLSAPALNTWVDGWEIDAYWEAERFAVEVDGWASHGSRTAFEKDRVRIEDLKLAGIDAIRISARRIERSPAEVGARLAKLLERRRHELRAAMRT